MSGVYRSAERKRFRLATKTSQACSCKFAVVGCEKRAASLSRQAHLCYSSRIFPSVYKGCVLLRLRVKN
jgi:hypothetical protein